jgi:hypothetical protein
MWFSGIFHLVLRADKLLHAVDESLPPTLLDRRTGGKRLKATLDAGIGRA